jgi:phosphorylase kinase alpha/beta subunit
VLRVNYLILLLTSELAAELKVTQDEGYEQLMHLTPFEIKNRLRQVLASYEKMNQLLKKREALHVRQSQAEIDWEIAPEKEGDITPLGGWRRQRQMSGATGRIPKDFYPNVWAVLSHCKGLVIGDKLERRNRLDSDPIVSEMTPGEKNFALTVEHLLNKIEAPEYRQMNVEALMELNAIARRNPELQVEDYIVLDVLIGYAVRLGWLERYPERSDRYDEDKAKAWHNFYESSPYVCAGYIVKAFRFLMESGQEEHVA